MSIKQTATVNQPQVAAISQKTKESVNLLVKALKKAGFRFFKMDVTPSMKGKGCVRLSFRNHQASSPDITNTLAAVQAIYSKDVRLEFKLRFPNEIGRYYSFEFTSGPIRYMSVDELYGSLYIDVD